jgi:hypothetical protein
MSNNMNAVTPDWMLVESYPFRQPERVFFNPYNQDEMWVTSFGNGMKVGYLNSTGLSDLTPDNYLVNVYPNPFNDELAFSKSDQGQILLKVNIYDLQGRLIISNLPEANLINTSSLNPGIYLVEFVFKDKSRVFEKVVKVGVDRK